MFKPWVSQGPILSRPRLSGAFHLGSPGTGSGWMAGQSPTGVR